MLRSTESDEDPPIVECGVGSKPHDLHRGGVRFARCRDCLVEQGERTSGRCIVADGVLTSIPRLIATRLGAYGFAQFPTATRGSSA